MNYTVRGPSQLEVAKVLGGRSAIITAPQHGCVVVFDEKSDEQDLKVIGKLATRLSSKLLCPVLAVMNHDDDVLCYQLYDKGELTDEYDSSPGYFDEDAETDAPSGGDAKKLCAVFEATNVPKVERVLRKCSSEEGGYTFETERHTQLARLLRLPSFSVGFSYKDVADGEAPPGIGPTSLMIVQ